MSRRGLSHRASVLSVWRSQHQTRPRRNKMYLRLEAHEKPPPAGTFMRTFPHRSQKRALARAPKIAPGRRRLFECQRKAAFLIPEIKVPVLVPFARSKICTYGACCLKCALEQGAFIVTFGHRSLLVTDPATDKRSVGSWSRFCFCVRSSSSRATRAWLPRGGLRTFRAPPPINL